MEKVRMVENDLLNTILVDIQEMIFEALQNGSQGDYVLVVPIEYEKILDTTIRNLYKDSKSKSWIAPNFTIGDCILTKCKPIFNIYSIDFMMVSENPQTPYIYSINLNEDSESAYYYGKPWKI
jgi:hypothetical protein